MRHLLLALTCTLLPLAAPAEPTLPPDEGGTIDSMGQPPTWFPYLGLSGGVHEPTGDGEATGHFTLGLFKNVLSPVASVGLAGEAYVGPRDGSADGGARAMLAVRPLRFALGLDYNFKEGDPDLILSFTHPIRRGGLLGMGGRVRLDYLPTRSNSVHLGVMFPLGQRWMGRTRPARDHVPLARPKRPPRRDDPVVAALEEAVANFRDAADWINRFTTPFFDPAGGSREEAMERFAERVHRFKAHIAERSALYPEGRSYPEEIRVYHAELDRAFTLAVSAGRAGGGPGESSPLGRQVSEQAREILLEKVILPYNRLLGRTKKPDSTEGFAARALEDFELWLNRNDDIPPGARPALRSVMQALLEEVEENRAGSAKYWETSELVWLPLHWARRPDQMRSQAQIDGLLERGVETRFSEGNEHHYVINEQFQWELLRHIQEAEDYHVLWIHDYRGLNTRKELDELGFDQVYYGYLKTLVRRVKDYDRTGKLPVYMVMLDQNFYEPNRGRLWMSFLEDPLRAKLKLPKGEGREEKERLIREAQAELRQAVEESVLLQQRARTHGEGWLRNRIKVHVNITNPVDWSFWSQRIIPVLGLPDVMMRDHRKISFRDVTERDPDRGEAIFTGMGVGEHYAGPTWEDRAILASGPALVGLKDACRQMLLNQGFEPGRIPYPLRPHAKPEDYGQRVQARIDRGLRFRSMQIHNQTGYAPKPIDVAKATLYETMPAGSVVVVPDSLWNSPFWAGMLTGNALRGGHVYVISPALDNAPSSGFPQMSRAQEIFAQMILIQDILGEEIDAVSGSLNTGIYAVEVDVGDLAGRMEQYFDDLPTNPLVRDFRGIPPGGSMSPEELAQIAARKQEILHQFKEMGFEPGYVATDVEVRKPKLHLKAQVMIDPQGQEALRRVDSPRIIDSVLVEWARQIHDDTEYTDVREAWKNNGRVWEEELRRVRREAEPGEFADAAAYLTVGSHNMDYRGMLMDGEVLYITAGAGILPGLVDLLIIAGISTWVDDIEQLEALVPAYSEWQRRMGRFMKYAL